MGLFDFGKKDKAIKQLSQEVTELKRFAAATTGFENIAMANIAANLNSNIAIYPAWSIKTANDRYLNTDDIYSIIRLLATTAALVPLYGYLSTPDKKAFTNLKKEVKGYNNVIKYKSLQTKALTDLPEDDPVAALIENPHQDMSKYEFFEGVYSNLFLHGEAFILKERPEDGVNIGLPIQLHLLYPQGVILKISNDLPRTIVAYDYRYEGKIIMENIPAEDVIHIKYFNPEMNIMGSELRGLSPLKVLQKRLTRLDSNMNTSVARLQNGGVETIVYEKGLGVDEERVDIIGKRKQNFHRFISNPDNAGAPFFANGEMGAIQLGSHLKDLGVLELGNVDFKKLCNVWGVSDILFNSDSASTESNVLTHTKRLYTNTILPNIFRVRDALVKHLLPDFKDGVLITGQDGEPVRVKGDGKSRYIDADISGISELHQDLERKAASLAIMWHLTPNEKREMMDWERYDDPKFDLPWIPTGYTPLDDFENMPPLPVATPNGN